MQMAQPTMSRSSGGTSGAGAGRERGHPTVTAFVSVFLLWFTYGDRDIPWRCECRLLFLMGPRLPKEQDGANSALFIVLEAV